MHGLNSGRARCPQPPRAARGQAHRWGVQVRGLQHRARPRAHRRRPGRHPRPRHRRPHATGAVALPRTTWPETPAERADRSVAVASTKGIILAGGSGTRLHPITRGISKQLMPVYDKPMVYYPLSTLMMAGIREILVITTPQDAGAVRAAARRRLRVGHRDLVRRAAPSRRPRPGLHHRRRLHRRRHRRAGARRQHLLRRRPRHRPARATPTLDGGHVFAYHVAEPAAYGVVEFDDDGTVLSIEEKPEQAASRATRSRACTSTTTTSSRSPRTSSRAPRGELEITAVNEAYLRRGDADASPSLPPRHGVARHRHLRGLLEASQFVHVVEARQGTRSAASRRSPGATAGSTTTSSRALADAAGSRAATATTCTACSPRRPRR